MRPLRLAVFGRYLAVSGALAGAACTGGAPEGSPELVGPDAALVFAATPVGESAEQTFTLQNDGGGELDVLTVSLADGDPRVWDIAWEPQVLGGGESLDVTLTFTPERADDREGARILVRADAEGLASLIVLASGEGAPSNADEDGDGFTVAEGDCDDGNDNRYPGADERCNGQDDDCDGSPDPDEADGDGDGQRLCDDDCDDTNGSVYPGAPEICDGLDSDCDGTNQDDADGDGDGVSVCEGDCDDGEAAAVPGGVEVCGDGLDNDCEGTIDSLDADLDGHDVCSAAGDCDDADPAAFPRVVSTAGVAGAVGSDGAPLASLTEALATLDDVCRVIYVEPGSYAESGLGWTAGEVAVIGRGALASDVTIDGAGAGRILDVTGGSVELRRLTLSGGLAPSGEGGGAARIAAGAELTAVACAFRGNSATTGGAIQVGGTLAIASGAVFDLNSATDGGAIAVTGGSLVDPGGSEYTANQASASGGAISADGPVVIAGPLFQGNTAVDGGAVALVGGGGHTVQRARFWQNAATARGGALWVGGTTSALIRNHRFQDDTAQTEGGAVWIGEGAVVTLANNTFTANTSTGEGAAVWIGSDGATVTSNLAHFHDGASGIWADPLGAAVVTHNTAFATSSLVDLGGALVVGTNDNTSENPAFVAFSDDGDPSNDDLSLQPTSPAIDTGPAASLDPNGSPNDRGYTGGPGAL